MGQTRINTGYTVGILGAMASEMEAIKAMVEQPQTELISGTNFVRGSIHGVDVVCATCGVGKVFAGMCAQTMILRYQPDLVINIGVAGSLSPCLNIGDIAVASSVVQHDMDATPLGFVKGEIPYSHQFMFPADEDMRRRAVQAVTAAAPDIYVFEGRVCSGDQFIASRTQKEAIISEFGGLCCEMEGAAIAQVCCLNDTPFVIIRAISDKADDSEEMSYIEFEKSAAERCAASTR